MALKFSKEQITKEIMSGNDHDVLREMYNIICPKVESYVARNSVLQEDGKDVFQEAIIIFNHCVL